MPGYNHYSWCMCGWCFKEGRNGYSPRELARHLDAFDADRRLEREGVKRSWVACFVNPNARCPVCSKSVYYYENEYGSRIFFDALGWPWPKHPCTGNSRNVSRFKSVNAGTLVARKLGEVKELLEAARLAGIDPNASFRSKFGCSPWDLLLVVSVTRSLLETFIEARSISPALDERVYLSYMTATESPAEGEFISLDGAQISFVSPVRLRPRTFKATILAKEVFMARVRDAMKKKSGLLAAQLPQIHAAAGALDAEPVRRYVRLRQLLGINTPRARTTFETEFTAYYGLNAGGVTPRFREVFYDRLYALRGKDVDDPPYVALLRELYEIPRYQGDKALPCSFVSKLVAIHDEAQPLFDKHVSRFFGVAAPQSASLDLRIAGFLSNLSVIKAIYLAWAEDPRFQEVFAEARARIPELSECDIARVCDFLVWQAGKMNGERAPDGPLDI